VTPPEATTHAEGTGQRWGCLVLDRRSRFVVAHASGPREEELAARVFAQTKQRSGGQPLAWCSDGWRPSPEQLQRVYRQPVHTGRRGRPRLRLPEGISPTQTIKHRDVHGRLLRVETRATFGTAVTQPALAHVERRNGVCRDRLNALTRKTHAFAKTAATWEALLDLHVFEQNWLRPHPALRVPASAGRCYNQSTPAMALCLTDHVWTWREFLTTPTRVSSYGSGDSRRGPYRWRLRWPRRHRSATDMADLIPTS
jgi:IS1 family transposase